jgi:hypothetical protein
MQENELVHAKSRKLRCTDASLNETMYECMMRKDGTKEHR